MAPRERKKMARTHALQVRRTARIRGWYHSVSDLCLAVTSFKLVRNRTACARTSCDVTNKTHHAWRALGMVQWPRQTYHVLQFTVARHDGRILVTEPLVTLLQHAHSCHGLVQLQGLHSLEHITRDTSEHSTSQHSTVYQHVREHGHLPQLAESSRVLRALPRASGFPLGACADWPAGTGALPQFCCA